MAPVIVDTGTEDENADIDDVCVMPSQDEVDTAANAGRASAIPLNLQQQVDSELKSWSKEWEVGHQYPDLGWDSVAIDLPPALQLHSFHQSLYTLPDTTGLGWDLGEQSSRFMNAKHET